MEALLLMIVCIVILAMAMAADAKSEIRKREMRCTRPATATIIEFKRGISVSYDDDGEKHVEQTCTPVLEYNAGGRLITKKSYVPGISDDADEISAFSDAMIEHTVDIKYNPDNPEEIVFPDM